MSTVPLYVLRNIAYPSGRRYPKLKKWVKPEDVCFKCEKEIKNGRSWIDGKGPLCGECARPLRIVPIVPPRHNIVDMPVRGNLDDTEYQFWIGRQLAYVTAAMCRACGEETNCKAERMEHKDKKDPKCTILIVHAYKELASKGACVVCRQKTTTTRWGIPICSHKCIETYKFDWDRKYIPLEIALMNAVRDGG